MKILLLSLSAIGILLAFGFLYSILRGNPPRKPGPGRVIFGLTLTLVEAIAVAYVALNWGPLP